jgi:hypothetical protein
MFDVGRSMFDVRCSLVSFLIRLAASQASGPPEAEHLKPLNSQITRQHLPKTIDMRLLRAHEKITSHFMRRSISSSCVAKARNIQIFLRFRALLAERLDA